MAGSHTHTHDRGGGWGCEEEYIQKMTYGTAHKSREWEGGGRQRRCLFVYLFHFHNKSGSPQKKLKSSNTKGIRRNYVVIKSSFHSSWHFSFPLFLLLLVVAPLFPLPVSLPLFPHTHAPHTPDSPLHPHQSKRVQPPHGPLALRHQQRRPVLITAAVGGVFLKHGDLAHLRLQLAPADGAA